MFSAASKTGSKAAPPANYIEDVFVPWLYTGNGSTQTIVNNIDLAGKGGLVWSKDRSNVNYHSLEDTVRGAGIDLASNSTGGNFPGGGITAFNNNGYDIDSFSRWNQSGLNYVNWSFRKQPKFFDVVTFTGNGSLQTINHNLGSVPGMIILKRTDGTSSWVTYHRGLTYPNANPINNGISLNSSAAGYDYTGIWGAGPTSTTFQFDTTGLSGWNFVVYLFAHNAGGFGTTGTDNVISCGSVVGTGAVMDINLGYEPQFLLYKYVDYPSPANWNIMDNMRGWGVASSQTQLLYPNLSNAEGNANYPKPTATGFQHAIASGYTIIYMAIRRPMKVPTDATTVFSPSAVNVSAGTQITTGFPIDWQIDYYRGFAANYNSINATRLTGVSSTSTESGQVLWTAKTDAESSFGMTLNWNNTGFQQTSQLWPDTNNIYWNFSRRPGFFDVVICKQTGSAQDVTHNLGVAPELLILKDRTSAVSWQVGTQFTSTTWNNLVLNSTDAGSVGGYNNYINAQPTSTVFRLGANLGSTGDSFVAYLFATCAGVSKVGSYTGNGSTQAISCGFTGGARFVLIKRTDSTGDWYVYDTARGMTTLTDPYLRLNSTAAESATLGSVTTTAGGFTVNGAVLAAINTSGASYIFLAIA
jgi:hypothetical protein